MQCDTLGLFRPKFASADGTQLELVEYHELILSRKCFGQLRTKFLCLVVPTTTSAISPRDLCLRSRKIRSGFCAFTGTEPPQAQAWLERYGWEVMVALNVMMDGDHEPPAAAAADTDHAARVL